MAHPAVAALELNLVGYRRTFRGSLAGSFLLPTLTMLGFGLGVGAYIDSGVAGVPYLDWIVPGLVASTALQTAVAESTFPVHSRFRWIRTYHALAASPLRVTDILLGQLLFLLFRVLTTSLVFVSVAAAFGTLHSAWAVAVLPVVCLLAVAVGNPTCAFTASVSSDSYLALLFRFGVIPMTLFAGVFFPVESLPLGLRWLAYASPLWHAVDLCRAATLGVAPAWSVPGHLGYLGLWAAFGWLLARAAFRRQLVV